MSPRLEYLEKYRIGFHVHISLQLLPAASRVYSWHWLMLSLLGFVLPDISSYVWCLPTYLVLSSLDFYLPDSSSYVPLFLLSPQLESELVICSNSCSSCLPQASAGGGESSPVHE